MDTRLKGYGFVSRSHNPLVVGSSPTGPTKLKDLRSIKKPVVGDRVKLDQVELVVREIQGQRIVRVGLKLGH